MNLKASHTVRRRMDGDVGVFLGTVEVARISVGNRAVTVDMARPEGLAVVASDTTVEEAAARFGKGAIRGLAGVPRHRHGDGVPLVVAAFLARHRARLGIDPLAALPEGWSDLAGFLNARSRIEPYDVYREMREWVPGCADAFWQHHHHWAGRRRDEFLESLPCVGDAAATPEEPRPDGRFLEVRRLGTEKLVRRVDVTGKDAAEVEAAMRTLLRSLGKGLYVEDAAYGATMENSVPGPR